MKIKKSICLLFFAALFLAACDDKEEKEPTPDIIQIQDLRAGTKRILSTSQPAGVFTDVPYDQPFTADFNTPLDVTTVPNSLELLESGATTPIELQVTFSNEDKSFSAAPQEPLKPLTLYSLAIKTTLRGKEKETFAGIVSNFMTAPGKLSLTNITINGTPAFNTSRISDVPLEGADIVLTFSAPVNPESFTNETVMFVGPDEVVQADVSFSENNTEVTVTPQTALTDLAKYTLQLTDGIRGADLETFQPYGRQFYSGESSSPKFPIISDDALLTLVQQQTFKYFWDFGHPVSGMARERNASGDVVTTGGTGFGLMSILVGIERNFITRAEGVERLDKIISFLADADRFHGAWPHWMNGVTGDVIPFSTNDNGGDLVETAFLVQGMLTVRQYLDAGNATEAALIDKINTLWRSVEWDWYTKGGENVLYWHWSPTVDWAMNHQLQGHNETLITYVLAASSPTHPVGQEAYHEGYARNGDIQNGGTFYDIVLPLGENRGGPLFFAHYSFLGLDPRNLSDQYANYWEQNRNHTLINRAYVIDNPKNFVGYSEHNWGLTASDNHNGYSAHSPSNDLGVITPTAALSSFPYTPDESMEALKFFYYGIGDRLWGEYGFRDAFNITEGWYANSYLAIDQGPIIVMIENYRTGLLWDLFMSAPEVQEGLGELGFSF